MLLVAGPGAGFSAVAGIVVNMMSGSISLMVGLCVTSGYRPLLKPAR